LEVEERRVLALQSVLTGVEEHILIHFVRMYLFRFAVPAVEIEHGGLEPAHVPAIQARLWACFVGRGLDDLIDRDSRFFGPAASATLFAVYCGLLLPTLGADAERFLRGVSTSVDECRTEGRPPEFERLTDDVCRRVDYFLAPTAGEWPDRLGLLRSFLGVTLGGCDLDDAFEDGCGRSATYLSRSLRAELADDEGKVLLGGRLWHWWRKTAVMLATEADRVNVELTRAGAPFAAGVVAQEAARLRSQTE